MNLTNEECEQWRRQPTINPKTKRTIKIGGPAYKNIEKACDPPVPKTMLSKEDCEVWRKHPGKHPLTKRKINQNAKNGIYAQLLKLCSSPKSRVPPGHPKTSSTAPFAPNDDLDKARAKLISAIKKVLAPIIHKADSIKVRKHFADIMKNYLKDVQQCIDMEADKIVLRNKTGSPAVVFENQIGTKSQYGMAFLTKGAGFGNLLKFSSKIMKVTADHKTEISLLNMMSKFVINETCPNMPVTYQTTKCTKTCAFTDCPEITKKSQYYVVVNELANCDLQTWLMQSYNDATYESIIMQLLFAVYSFHQLKYLHNDCHLGNFLIHNIKPGGYWKYKIYDRTVYVPNMGYLLVLWDPGLASKGSRNIEYEIDYGRFLELIIYMQEYKTYRDKGLKPLPYRLVNYGLVPIINTLTYTDLKETFALEQVFQNIKDNIIKFPHVLIDQEPSNVLNTKAYSCKYVT